MNKCNEDFIKRENIDFSKIDRTIYDTKDINEIIKKYRVYGDSVNELVSLEQILGIEVEEFDKKSNFPEILDLYFDEYGDSYRSRSISMLEFNEDNVIDGLSSSFKYEPLRLTESDLDKYTISINGIHRFIIMRILYLTAKSKCQNEEELNELIKKYTIPVIVSKIDYLKTYCKYLIDLFQPVSCMGECLEFKWSKTKAFNREIYYITRYINYNKIEDIFLSKKEYDLYKKSYIELRAEYKDSRVTGRSKLTRFNGGTQILTDEELLSFTRRIIEETPKNKKKIIEVLRVQSIKYESLNRFLNLYFPDLLNYKKGEDRKNGSITRKYK